MKKINKLIALALCAVTLTGFTSCNKGGGESSSSSSSSTSSSVVTSLWKSSDESLMKKYCGEVLPYPSDGLFEGEVTVEEIKGENGGDSYLEIVDHAEEFSLENYYKQFQDNSKWNIITSYNGDVVQGRSGATEYVEMTKNSDDNSIGYGILYYHRDKQTITSTDGSTKVIEAGNVIQCYNTYCTKTTTATAWSESEAAYINYVTTFDIPFIQLGEENVVAASNENTLSIYDFYTKNLTKEYADILMNNGFTLQKITSQDDDSYVLIKELSDGSNVRAQLYYLNGNNFNFYYTPKVEYSSEWPTELVAEIKTKSGIEIPQFEMADGGSYIYYKKNNVYSIYTLNLKDGYNYETYAYNRLNIIQNTWSEKIGFITRNLTDDNQDVIGFQVIAMVYTPSSTFTQSWPSSKITETMKSLNIEGIDIPGIEDSDLPTTSISGTYDQIKYEIKGQEVFDQNYEYYYDDIKKSPEYYGYEEGTELSEEEIVKLATTLSRREEGIQISIFDKNYQASQALYNKLFTAGWYEYEDMEGQVTFEDPNGKLAVTFQSDTYSDPSHDNEGLTSIFIHPGLEEVHSQEFKFIRTCSVEHTDEEKAADSKLAEEHYEVGIGLEKQIYVERKMLPYTITYTSDTDGITVDSNGIVKVADTVADNTWAKITASIQVPGETNPRTITINVLAKKILSYTNSEVIDAISTKLQGKGYNPVVYHPASGTGKIEFDQLTLNFGTNMSVVQVKYLVENDLALEGFTKDDDGWQNEDGVIIGNDDIKADVIQYHFINDYVAIATEYIIYTNADDEVILLIYSY